MNEKPENDRIKSLQKLADTLNDANLDSGIPLEYGYWKVLTDTSKGSICFVTKGTPVPKIQADMVRGLFLSGVPQHPACRVISSYEKDAMAIHNSNEISSTVYVTSLATIGFLPTSKIDDIKKLTDNAENYYWEYLKMGLEWVKIRMNNEGQKKIGVEDFAARMAEKISEIAEKVKKRP